MLTTRILVDVRDAEALRTVLAGIRNDLGPIRGLVHGAGVLADRLIVDKTAEQFAAVYETKAASLQAMLESLEHDDLGLLALFSSSTARFGRAGQVDYAVANEVVNKLAQREARRRPDHNKFPTNQECAEQIQRCKTNACSDTDAAQVSNAEDAFRNCRHQSQCKKLESRSYTNL